MSAEEIADYEQLRKLISHEKSLELVDDFAKWLFAMAAVVGTLGTSFGVSGANDLTGLGRTMFAIGVASLGVSLAIAALARLPMSIRVNRNSPDSLASGVSKLVRTRAAMLFIAAILFALALVLAGLAPLFS